jgi:hypothetical protein
MAKKITSWSFSRYSDYKQCPLKCKLKHIDKFAEPRGAALLRGEAIHSLAEKYIRGMISRMPAELKLFANMFKELKAKFKKQPAMMVVEDNWAFTKNWDETQWDNWAECWVRLKLDCATHEDDVTLRIRDWKTGKFRIEQNEEYVEQLELYALAALLIGEHIERVIPELVYLDQGVVYPEVGSELIFTRADIPRLKKLWVKRTKPMLSDTIFSPRANSNCRWCWFGQSKKSDGGPGLCKF